MISEELRHKHSGLAGDGEKIKYSDIEGIPATSGGQYYCGNSDRLVGSGTGLQSITGVGFKPKMITIQAVYPASNGSMSFGQATSTDNEYAVYTFSNPNPGTMSYVSGAIIHCDWSSPGSGNAQLYSIDDDGFTLNWTSVAFDVNFMFQCYG